MKVILIEHVVMTVALILSVTSLIKLVRENNIFTMIDDAEMETPKEEECKDIAA